MNHNFLYIFILLIIVFSLFCMKNNVVKVRENYLSNFVEEDVINDNQFKKNLPQRIESNLVHIISSLSLSQAKTISYHLVNERKINNFLPMAFVIIDNGGNDVISFREDGCGLKRIDIARGKANSCMSMGLSSRKVGKILGDRPTFINSISAMSDGSFIDLPGGVFILNNRNDAIGAVGSSGDTSDNDEKVIVNAIIKSGLIPFIKN